MNKIRMSIEEIIKKYELDFNEYVVSNSIIDEKVNEKYTEFMEKEKNNMSNLKLKRFVIDNQEGIGKEEFVLYTLSYYNELIEALKEVQKNPKKEELYRFGINSVQEFNNYTEYEKNKYNKFKKAFQDFDYIIAKEQYQPEYKDRSIYCEDAKYYLGKRNEKKKVERMKHIKEELKEIKHNDLTGYEVVWSLLTAKEKTNIYDSDSLNKEFFKLCINKYIMKEYNILAKDIDNVVKNEGLMENVYKEVDKSSDYTNIAKSAAETKPEYVDIDKFLMYAGIRIIALNESGNEFEDTKELEFFKKILETVRKNIKTEKRKEIDVYAKCKKIDTFNFSKKEIDKSLRRYQNDKYINSNEINEIRELMFKGKQNLSETDINLDILFDKDELKWLLFSNDENFEYLKNKFSEKEIISEGIRSLKRGIFDVECRNVIEGLTRMNLLDKETIYELYEGKAIKSEEINYILNFMNLEDIVDINKMLQLYEERDKNKKSEEMYSNYLKYNKEVSNESNKNEEGISKYSEVLMEKLAENYDENSREEYIQRLENFYQEGMLDLRSIISWEDQNIVVNFLKDKILNIRALILLKNKGVITEQYFQDLFGEILLGDEVTDEFRMDSYKKGLVSDDYIAKAYIEGLISKKELKELIELGKISKENNIIKAKLHEEFLEKLNNTIDVNSGEHDRKIDLSDVKKFNGRINGPSTIQPGKKYYGKTTKIIKATQRENYFKLFGAAYYTDKIRVDLNGAFSDYDFYIIPDENGEIGENSVIIAERYYNDRKLQDEYAVDNRTYFFRCEDFVDSLTKDETSTNKRMFRVNHKLSQKNKKGTWAQKVKEAIAKTMLGDDLSEYSESNANKIIEQKLKSFYTEKELSAINEKCDEIDYGLHDEELR